MDPCRGLSDAELPESRGDFAGWRGDGLGALCTMVSLGGRLGAGSTRRSRLRGGLAAHSV